ADQALTARQAMWRRAGLAVEPGMAGSALPPGLLLAGALVALALSLPTELSARTLAERLHGAAEEPAKPVADARAELQRLFGGVVGNVRDASNGFASTLTLQGE